MGPPQSGSRHRRLQVLDLPSRQFTDVFAHRTDALWVGRFAPDGRHVAFVACVFSPGDGRFLLFVTERDGARCLCAWARAGTPVDGRRRRRQSRAWRFPEVTSHA